VCALAGFVAEMMRFLRKPYGAPKAWQQACHCHRQCHQPTSVSAVRRPPEFYCVFLKKTRKLYSFIGLYYIVFYVGVHITLREKLALVTGVNRLW
jgi:hypothetical protein